MTTIEKQLVPGENIIFRTKKHYIIFFIPALLLIISILSVPYLEANPILVKIQWVPWLVTVLVWAYVGLEYYTSNFVVTNHRIIMREGFFTRHGSELRLSSISQVNVNQNILGQIFNYGEVSINTFGVFDAFTNIARPNDFQQHVNEQLYRDRNKNAQE